MTPKRWRIAMLFALLLDLPSLAGCSMTDEQRTLMGAALYNWGQGMSYRSYYPARPQTSTVTCITPRTCTITSF